MELNSVQSSNLIAIKVEARTPSEKASQSPQGPSTSGVVPELSAKASAPGNSYSSVNSLINLGNIAAYGIDEATGLVQSLIDEVNKGDFEKVYKALPDVGSALSNIAGRKTPEGATPLSGQEFVIDVQPSKTLRFPTDVRDAFGLSRTPPPDEYDLAELQTKFDAFRNESKTILSAIYRGATIADIAAQNMQASAVKVSDVDQAAALASNTVKAITQRPQEALNASGADLSSSARLIE